MDLLCVSCAFRLPYIAAKDANLSKRYIERCTEYKYRRSSKQDDTETIKETRWQGCLSGPINFKALLTKLRTVCLMLTKLRNFGLMQNGRATPGTISSGPRRSSRPNGSKPASGLGSKKRKHSASTSPGHSESQDGPSSNTSGGLYFAHCFQQVPCVCCQGHVADG